MEGGFDGILPRTPTALIIMALTHATPGAPCDVRPLGPRLGASLSVALFKSRQLEVIRLVLPAGKTMPPHSVHGEITLQCIEGLLQVELRAGVQVLEPGQLLFLTGDELHAVSAPVDSSALLTIVLTPRQEAAPG